MFRFRFRRDVFDIIPSVDTLLFFWLLFHVPLRNNGLPMSYVFYVVARSSSLFGTPYKLAIL